MKKGLIIFCVALQGAAVSAIAIGIQQWGKATTAKESLMIFMALVFFIIPCIIFYKNNEAVSGDKTPDPSAPAARKFFSRYPVLTWLMASVVGIAVGVTVFLLLAGAS